MPISKTASALAMVPNRDGLERFAADGDERLGDCAYGVGTPERDRHVPVH
jgi:hypothetical protein